MSLLPYFCRLRVPYVGHIWKAVEKGYLEHLGSACCTDDMAEALRILTRNDSMGRQPLAGRGLRIVVRPSGPA